jgi:hypothetical protein
MKIKNILCLVSTLLIATSCTYNPARSVKSHFIPDSNLYSEKTFIAMQYFAGILNRTVKVYVLKDLLSVGKVGGLIADPIVATEEWYNPKSYVDPKLEYRYKNIDPSSEIFLSIADSNYQIKLSSIVKIEFDPTDKWGMGAVPHTGKIYVNTLDGNKYEFILLGIQDGVHIKTMIEEAMQETR